jgi:hypothetical protein
MRHGREHVPLGPDTSSFHPYPLLSGFERTSQQKRYNHGNNPLRVDYYLTKHQKEDKLSDSKEYN